MSVIHWNMDRKVLRKGGRKVPVMTEDQLSELFSVVLNCDDDLEEMKETIYEVVSDYEHPLLAKALKDLQKIEVDFENFMIEDIATGRNGVPYIKVLFGGDWEVPVAGMI